MPTGPGHASQALDRKKWEEDRLRREAAPRRNAEEKRSAEDEEKALKARERERSTTAGGTTAQGTPKPKGGKRRPLEEGAQKPRVESRTRGLR